VIIINGASKRILVPQSYSFNIEKDVGDVEIVQNQSLQIFSWSAIQTYSPTLEN
jgi:hypothetical protein